MDLMGFLRLVMLLLRSSGQDFKKLVSQDLLLLNVTWIFTRFTKGLQILVKKRNLKTKTYVVPISLAIQ